MAKSRSRWAAEPAVWPGTHIGVRIDATQDRGQFQYRPRSARTAAVRWSCRRFNANQENRAEKGISSHSIQWIISFGGHISGCLDARRSHYSDSACALMLILAFIALNGCGRPPSVVSMGNGFLAARSEISPPEPGDVISSGPMKLWATHFHVHLANAVPDGIPLTLRDDSHSPQRLSLADWCHAAMEGTVAVVDDSQRLVYNHYDHAADARIDCASIFPRLSSALLARMSRSRFMYSRSQFGHGVQGLNLVPYRSIAVDPDIIPIGSVVYIPRARGLAIQSPNGSSLTHDGYFFAADVGSAISGNQIDVFGGYGGINPLPSLINSDPTEKFDAFLVADDELTHIFSHWHRL